MPRLLPIYIAVGAVIGVIAAYLIAGGASYKPLTVADPCEPRSEQILSERGVLEGVALSALDGAACELQVTREQLIAALADDAVLEEFSSERGIDPSDVEAAIRSGLVRAVDDAEREQLLAGPVASLMRGVAENAPVGTAIRLFRALPGNPTLPEAIAAIAELGLDLDELRQLGLDQIEGLRDDLGGLLPDSLGEILPEELPELSPEQQDQLEELFTP